MSLRVWIRNWVQKLTRVEAKQRSTIAFQGGSLILEGSGNAHGRLRSCSMRDLVRDETASFSGAVLSSKQHD